MQSIPIHLSEDLHKVLRENKIQTSDYKPAYNGTSVGLDLYNCGPTISVPPAQTNYTEDFVFHGVASTELTEKQFAQVFKILIPTGLRIILPSNHMALIQERGSILKTPLKIRAGVIDPQYTDEIFVNCVNLSSRLHHIQHGQKLPFQLIVVPTFSVFNHINTEEFKTLTETALRGDGKIGSSDR